MQSHATDAGPTGPDNQFGAGLLHLPAAKTTSAAVTLTPSSGSATTGKVVTLTALAPKLPRGYRLLIQRHGQNSSAWSKLAECAARTCVGRWTESNAAADAFRAEGIQRKNGAKGAIVRIWHTSPAVAVSWASSTPPPPTQPQPPAPGTPPSGHYSGTSDQGYPVSFDFSATAKSLQNVTAQVDADCGRPGHVHFYTSAPISITVQSDWSFSEAFFVNNDAGGDGRFYFRGQLTSDGRAVGSVQGEIGWSSGPYKGINCQSNPVSFTLTKS